MRRLISCAAAAATFAAILPAGITAAADTPPEAPEGYLAYYSFDGTAAENEKLTVIKPDSWQGRQAAAPLPQPPLEPVDEEQEDSEEMPLTLF